LDRIERDLRSTADVTFDSASVLSRFEGTGVISRDVAEDLGLVGPVARASGLSRDVRRDHPYGIYRFAIIPVSGGEGGDVMARAMVRWLEVQRSLVFVREQLAEYRGGPLAVPLPSPRVSAVAVALVEGWRGEIVHVAATAADGSLNGYRIVDPSFHNWFALTLALRDNQVSDFPLCNKSFNLSYAGHDL
jgi:Ni,Fe-hydrogenase III large subunit